MAKMSKPDNREAIAAERSLVLFRGVPSNLTGVLRVRANSDSEIILLVTGLSEAKEPVEVAVQADSDPRILRIFLPPDTVPGTYAAVLSVDGSDRGARVDVEPSPHLRVFPEQLRIIARAGEDVPRSLTMLNAGNVAIEIRKVQAFGVILSGGIERALRRAYVTRLVPEQRRIDVIADSLAEAHGGLVKMALSAGAGTLAPGEVRTIDVSVRLPDDLTSGGEYTGNWELAGLVYPVTIQVTGTSGSDEGDDPAANGDTPVIR